MIVSPGSISAFTGTSYTFTLSIVEIPQEVILQVYVPLELTYRENPVPDNGANQLTFAFDGADTDNWTESPEQNKTDGNASKTGVL